MRWIFLRDIDELIPEVSVKGRTHFDPALELFGDHFPGWPVVPGVVMLETLAQLSGKAIGYTVRLQRGDWPFPILSMMHNVKFRRFVRPSEEVTLEASFVALREESAVMKVRASVAGKRVTEAQQTFVFNALPLEDEAHRARLEQVEGGELARLWPGFDPKVWA